MFNFRPDRARIGFAVEPDEPPGFRVGADGLPLSAPASRPEASSLPTAPDAADPLTVSDLLVQTGEPLEPNAMTELKDRFVGNTYWPAERDRRMVSPIVPAGYELPMPALLPGPEEMQATPTWRSESPVNAEKQGVPDPSVPSTGGLPSGIGSPQSRIMVQYNPEGAPPPLPAPPPPKSPELDTSPGEVVVAPDGSKIADTDPTSPTGYVMSPKMDLRDVAAKGRQIGEVYRSMRAHPATSGSALMYLYLNLALNAGQGGTYDHQRRGRRAADQPPSDAPTPHLP